MTHTLLFLLFSITVLSAQDDIKAHRRCVECNMDRKAYGFSRMVVHFEDGTETGVCSINCALDVVNADTSRKAKSFEAADRNTRILVDAEKATWVIGGDKPGVMSKIAKWAFANKTDAEEFIAGHGGRLASFTEALEAARKSPVQKR